MTARAPPAVDSAGVALFFLEQVRTTVQQLLPHSHPDGFPASFPVIGTRPGHVVPKRFVYILKSMDHPDQYYVGVTNDVAARMAAHNAALTPSTMKHRRWRTLVVIEFDEEQSAIGVCYGLAT